MGKYPYLRKLYSRTRYLVKALIRYVYGFFPNEYLKQAYDFVSEAY
jgi:hypothetical protein